MRPRISTQDHVMPNREGPRREGPARKRRLLLLAVPLAAGLALAGCGSSKPASASATSTTSGNTNAEVSATGVFGKAPVVTIPKAKASSQLQVKTLISGTGSTVTASEAVLTNYVIYKWSGTSHTQLGTTYATTPYLFSDPLPLPGLQKALVGAKVGSRVLAVMPPKYGFGTSGNSSAGIAATDTLVFVVDVVKAYQGTAAATGSAVSSGGGTLPTVTEPATAGTAPTVKMPKAKPGSALIAKTLIKGTGAAVTKGQYLIAQYVGYNYRTGKVFDSSWSRKSEFGFQIGAAQEQVIPGWDQGLVGQTVGSRVLLVIPPKDGYGTSGNSSAGIEGTDTLVFVVDIVDAVSGT